MGLAVGLDVEMATRVLCCDRTREGHRTWGMARRQLPDIDLDRGAHLRYLVGNTNKSKVLVRRSESRFNLGHARCLSVWNLIT